MDRPIDLVFVKAKAAELGEDKQAAANTECQRIGRHGPNATPEQLKALKTLSTHHNKGGLLRYCDSCWTAFWPDGKPVKSIDGGSM